MASEATLLCSSAFREPAKPRFRRTRPRGLIGDDEHGWSEDGIFNFEGGCYAKAIRLSLETEPEIYQATQMFGTILENVIVDEHTREIDYDSDLITENTRAFLSCGFHFERRVPSGVGGHPENIVFLTADAFGVLPPVARLTPVQAIVSLPLWLYRQGCWHGKGRYRAQCNL